MSLRPVIVIGALLSSGCGPEPPDPCTPMCAAATTLYGSCLDGWGAAWTDAGYEDEADFLDACETWAWSARLLEDEAGETGRIDATCRERTVQYTDGTCEDFLATDWSTLPWQAPPTPRDTGQPDG